MNPQVTIIIAAYNASGTIARAVCSALAEPEVAEVIVVDDASSDNTANRARNVDDKSGRLKILIQSRNAGPSVARNRAIEESKAPWIGILDADDFFLPGRMARLLSFADTADLIADDMAQVTEGAVDGPRQGLLGVGFTKPELIDFAAFVSSDVTDSGRRGFGFIKPLMRRSFLATHAIRYQDHMRLGEDYELYARALALGARLYIMPGQGYVSVVRPSSLSSQHAEADLLHFRDCDLALATIAGLTQQDKAALRQHYLSVDCRLQWRRLIRAAKERNARDALATFRRPYPVPFYVLTRLIEECGRRIMVPFKRRAS